MVHEGNIRLSPWETVTPELAVRLGKHKAEVIRALRLSEMDEDQLCEWQERVAICMEDGALSRNEAEPIAFQQVVRRGEIHALAADSRAKGR